MSVVRAERLVGGYRAGPAQRVGGGAHLALRAPADGRRCPREATVSWPRGRRRPALMFVTRYSPVGAGAGAGAGAADHSPVSWPPHATRGPGDRRMSRFITVTRHPCSCPSDPSAAVRPPRPAGASPGGPFIAPRAARGCANRAGQRPPMVHRYSSACHARFPHGPFDIVT